MNGEIEVAADLATGAVVARAVEPLAGEAAGADGSRCLNCGAALDGRFCAGCGQSATVHRTLTAFWHDFLHSILHFDGKFWRTLPLLVWKPGDLTRRYVHGERAKFISPLALFLFSVFSMFAVFSWVGGPITPGANTVRDDRVLTPQSFDAELRSRRTELAELEARRRADTPAGAAMDARIASVKEDIAGLETGARFTQGMSENRVRLDESVVQTGNKQLDEKIRHAFENPQLLLYKVQSNAYKFSWLLVPISLPFVWLLFAWRREFHIYDHLVFITYSLCFMTFLLVLMSFFGRLGPLNALQEPVLTIVPPIHTFVHLRGAYALSIGGALWRTVALLMSAFLALLLFTLILLAIGVF